jgi:putative transposase
MKPNTYTRLYVHCIFTPKGHEALLSEEYQSKIHKYIYGTIEAKGCVPIAINGSTDHVHILTRFKPKTCIEDLIRDIKRSSSLFINTNRFFPFKFNWQEGYGAFTVGYPQLDKVFHYIVNQKQHHEKQSFKNEYMQCLTDEGVDFKSEHLYEFYE